MTDVVISGMRYRGIETMPTTQLSHMADLTKQAIINYNELVKRYKVATILYSGRTYLEQLNDAAVLIDQVLTKRNAK